MKAHLFFFLFLLLAAMIGCQKADDDTIYIPSEPNEEEPQIEYVELQCENRDLPCLITRAYFDNYNQDSVFTRTYYHFDSLDRVIDDYRYSSKRDDEYHRTKYLYYENETVPYRIEYFREENLTTIGRLTYNDDGTRLLSRDNSLVGTDVCSPDRTYTYNSQGKLIRTYQCSSAGNVIAETESTYFRNGDAVDSIYAYLSVDTMSRRDKIYLEYTDISHRIDQRLLQAGMFPVAGSHSSKLIKNSMLLYGENTSGILSEFSYEIDSSGRIRSFVKSPTGGRTDFFY